MGMNMGTGGRCERAPVEVRNKVVVYNSFHFLAVVPDCPVAVVAVAVVVGLQVEPA